MPLLNKTWHCLYSCCLWCYLSPRELRRKWYQLDSWIIVREDFHTVILTFSVSFIWTQWPKQSKWLEIKSATAVGLHWLNIPVTRNWVTKLCGKLYFPSEELVFVMFSLIWYSTFHVQKEEMDISPTLKSYPQPGLACSPLQLSMCGCHHTKVRTGSHIGNNFMKHRRPEVGIHLQETCLTLDHRCYVPPYLPWHLRAAGTSLVFRAAAKIRWEGISDRKLLALACSSFIA